MQIENVSNSLKRYGTLIFSTRLADRICNKMSILNHQNFLTAHGSILSTCLTIQTKVQLVDEMKNKHGGFEVGLQVFQDSQLTFVQDQALLDMIFNSNAQLIYSWRITHQKDIFRNDFDRRFKFLTFSFLEFSWAMAAVKCQEYGMTLPHLKNQEMMEQFVMYILDKYLFPTYVLFIGLLKKVTKLMNTFLVIFF